MFGNRKLRKGIAGLLLAATLTGCAGVQNNSGQADGNAGANGIPALETAPVLDYTVPDVLPGMLLNQIGYRPSSYKTVVVQGVELPDCFYIKDAATEKIVYTGIFEEQGYDEVTGEYTGYGDFSDFTTEGSYYLECEVLGLTYDFVIRDSLYVDLMNENLQFLADKRQNLTVQHIPDVCVGMSTLLLSYELYGSVYDGLDETLTEPAMITEVKNYVEWLRTGLDAESGAVMDGEVAMATETAWTAAVLAKFSYTYQKYDSVYATACLQAADKAWTYLDKNKADVSDGLMFYGASELYRATGRYQYRVAAENLGKVLEADVSDQAQLFGMLTYGFTKRRVDVNLCNTLLAAVFDEAEALAQEDREGYFVTEGTLTPQGLKTFLWDVLILASVDYVITNSEYATLIARNHSYLAGENAGARCYISSAEADAVAGYKTADCCEFIAGHMMILSEIMSHEQEE